MDQIKTGKFISATRKELGMTQKELAQILNISDKTVSKWECGKGLPDVSLMLPLCENLKISVNELLSGERLSENNYRQKAEENMMNLIKEKEENKKKIILSAAVAAMAVLAAVPLILVAGISEFSTAARVGLITVATVILIIGIAVACVLDREAGTFECTKCGERFVPDMKSYVMGAHTLTRRQLKCPHCGKTSFCKHRLTK